MLIVDAQVHIWAADTPQRPWPVRYAAHTAVPFSIDYVLREMNAAGVDRVVIVPPSWEGDRNDLGLEAARLHPDRVALTGRLDTDAPDAREQLGRWLSQPGMLGLRLNFGAPLLRKPLVDGSVNWLWGAAEKAGVPLVVRVFHSYAHLIDRVAQRHPALKIVMDHLALENDKRDDAAFAELDKLLVMAKRPNVAVKATCLPSYTSDTYPFRRLQPYLRRVYDAFGPRRIFWGTDLSRLPCTYREAVTMITEEIPWLTAGDKEWIMGRGICEWLDWELLR